MVTLYQSLDATDPFRAAQRTRVSVNGVVIPPDVVAREAQYHPAETPLAAWREAARALATRELLLQEAHRLALAADPQSDEGDRRETNEEALIRAVVEQAVTTPDPDEATCRRYYERNRSRFRSPDIFEAAHILIAARPDQDDPLADARQKSKDILAVLDQRPDAFGELAAACSACPSGQAGGNLGQITRGDTTPEFEAALLALSPGKTTQEPVATRYGLHIIRLDRRVDGNALPFGAVHQRIAAYLAERSRRQVIAQYLARLASCAQIAGIALPSTSDLRVS